MKALVTGARGFLGRHIAAELARAGYEVTGIGRGCWSPEEWQALGIRQWVESDITLDALRDIPDAPSLIVHCAGGASVAYSLSQPHGDFCQTVTSTAILLEYIRTTVPDSSLVYLSSAAVYGSVMKLPIMEDQALNPVSPYGWHKKMAEDLCHLYSASYGLKIGIVRLFSIFGPGLKKQLLWDACKKIVSGKNLYAGSGFELRDWLYIDDAVSLTMAVSNNCSSPPLIVNGGSGVAVSVREILNEVYAAYDSQKSPEFTGDIRIGDPPGYMADISQARQLKWSPKNLWSTGVRDYVNWFKGDVL